MRKHKFARLLGGLLLVLLLGGCYRVGEQPQLTGEWTLISLTGLDGTAVVAEQMPEQLNMEPEIFDLVIHEDNTWSWPVAQERGVDSSAGSWESGMIDESLDTPSDPEAEETRIHMETYGAEAVYYFTFVFDGGSYAGEQMIGRLTRLGDGNVQFWLEHDGEFLAYRTQE